MYAKNVQLHQTRVTQLTNLPALQHLGLRKGTQDVTGHWNYQHRARRQILMCQRETKRHALGRGVQRDLFVTSPEEPEAFGANSEDFRLGWHRETPAQAAQTPST